MSYPRLCIHQININNGDCTLIEVINENNAVVGRVLLDGGNSDASRFVVPYLQTANVMNTVALSHFHKDHYEGLEGMRNGELRTTGYVDAGGYSLTNVAPQPGFAPIGLNPATVNNITPPKAPSLSYLQALKEGVMANAPGPFITSRGTPNLYPSQLGVTYTIATLRYNNVDFPVQLTCVAANAFNVTNTGVAPAPAGRLPFGSLNANNFSLAFVLTFGKFRYYTGGDIGGYSGAPCGSYIDQETGLAQAFQNMFPTSQSWSGGPNKAGHICAIKASHHGSKCSNNSTFLNTTSPSAIVTSAGSNRAWKLPSVPCLQRFAADAIPLGTDQGFFFTNLYDYGGANNSRAVAEALFGLGAPARQNTAGANVSMDLEYGDMENGDPSSYMIVVPLRFRYQGQVRTVQDASYFKVVQKESYADTGHQVGAYMCHH
ncbi:hypothetical protein MUN81_07365 [Hymenobacter sp. 5317J-9]|uniref:hypothetical protein n=1 Tax=Hymenobacter sp. 5317J-9 TaxID=2932250 RepID=UPI001FD6FECA|nr:hypothetical protein [Hymenobacter sp. 5317J-9]UOQ99310.1 hypothetical protein MUN81_07365 [Hymenobacter sp. 5317J-9]